MSYPAWPILWAAIKADLAACVGVKYKFGHEFKDLDAFPPKLIDCSELVELVFARAGFAVPDGSFNQHKQSFVLLPEEVRPGDLGFFADPKKSKPWNPSGIYHVGILYTPATVIEAHGRPYNKVVIRRRKTWEEKDAFKRAGGWRRLNVLRGIE